MIIVLLYKTWEGSAIPILPFPFYHAPPAGYGTLDEYLVLTKQPIAFFIALWYKTFIKKYPKS
jgi:hypothetical protein